MADWITALGKALGIRMTPENRRFLTTWQRWEGGHTNNAARFNWLNTTRDAPGVARSINSRGVKAFKSFQYGIQATVATLTSGRYDDIIDSLASGDPYAFHPSAGLQTWVSGSPDGNPGYAQKILGYRPSGNPTHRARMKVKRIRRDAAAEGTAVRDMIRVVFNDDPEMRSLLLSLDDVGAQQAGVVDPGGSLVPEPVGEGARGRLLTAAQSQLGKPYVFGSGPDTSSFDCSDLIQWSYRQIGISIPRTTYDQIKVGRPVKGGLKVGDLIFPHTGHVVMYVGNGKVIAAPRTGTVVQFQNLSSFGKPVAVRRIL